MSETANKAKKRNSQLSEIADRTAFGRWVSSRFFKRHMVQTVFIVALIMVYISNRYDCITGMETINDLQEKLDIAKTEFQNQKSGYMSATREISMRKLVDDLHMNLEIQDRPPYQVTY